MKQDKINSKKISLKIQIIIIFTLLCILHIFLLHAISSYPHLSEAKMRMLMKFIVISIASYIVSIIVLIILFANPLKAITRYIKYYENTGIIKGENINKIYFGIFNKEFSELLFEFNNRNQIIIDKNNKLVKSNELKRELLNSVAHEIKTPLTSIYIILTSILDGVLNIDEMKNELSISIKEIDKIKGILKHLGSLYQLEEQNFELVKENKLIDTLVNDTILICRHIKSKYNQSIVFKNEVNFTVNVDINYMLRALNNILSNAIIHTPINSNIEIICNEYDEKYNRLDIVNYGINIEEEEITNLFEPFYKVDKSRVKEKGFESGLGLYIVDLILKKHKLDFNICNVKDGVKFRILFPKI